MNRKQGDTFTEHGPAIVGGEQAASDGDPGPLPDDLLYVPGFIGDVMADTLRSAPHPNRVLAFAGALALQSFLVSRSTRDDGNTRGNLYVLALAHSGAGKDAPRKMNAEVLRSVGLQGGMAHQLASGEGLQDALMATPSLLAQTDEFDTLLQSMRRDREGRLESLIGTLLSLYSSSSSMYPMRRKAGDGKPGAIDRPCFILLGTAIPNHYYAALNERMLTNGLFARMLVFEAGSRGPGQSPGLLEPSPKVLETAQFWADQGGFDESSSQRAPEPRTLALSKEAQFAFAIFSKRVDALYAEAEARSDPVSTTVWARAAENARKLALLYTLSADREATVVTLEATDWAVRVVEHQVRRMLHMASSLATGEGFEQLMQRIHTTVLKSPDGIKRSELLKRSKLKKSSFDEVIETLIERDDLVKEEVRTKGRRGTVYHATGNKGEGSVKEDRG